jgi:hypothetical protein
MPNLLKKINLTLLSFLLCLPLSKAQFEAGVFVGVCNYQGDLANNTIEFIETKPGFGALVRYTPNRFITIRGNYMQGKLTGTDLHSSEPGVRYRGFSFRSTIREISVVGEYNFLGNSNEQNYQGGGVFVNPYILAGVGFASTDGGPVAPEDTRPYPFPEVGAKSVIPAFPLGLGVKVQFGDHFSVGFDIASRLTFSDYLDGVSKTGNPAKKDWYIFGGLTLTYCFGEYSN